MRERSPIQPRATFRFSNAACAASISTAAKKHLHRYLAEYDFRYNHRVKLGFNDTDRATIAVTQASGKRLTYRQAH